MSLGKLRRIERVWPGWLVWSGSPDYGVPWAWREVAKVTGAESLVVIALTDGNRLGGQTGDEVRCITLSEKRQRRIALGEEKASA